MSETLASSRIPITHCHVCGKVGRDGLWAPDLHALVETAAPSKPELAAKEANFILVPGICPPCDAARIAQGALFSDPQLSFLAA